MALQLDVVSERAHGPLRPPAAPPLASPASSASAPDETAPRDWLSLAQLILMDWQQAAGEYEGAASPAAPPPPRASAPSRPSLCGGAAPRWWAPRRAAGRGGEARGVMRRWRRRTTSQSWRPWMRRRRRAGTQADGRRARKGARVGQALMMCELHARKLPHVHIVNSNPPAPHNFRNLRISAHPLTPQERNDSLHQSQA